MTQDLSHLNQQGEVHMVDVGDRPATTARPMPVGPFAWMPQPSD